MRRARLTAVVVLLAVGLVATGASDPLPSPAASVELAPAAAASEYATFDDSGQLRLDVTRLNAESRTRITSAFTITNTGPPNATVWLTDETDAVTFTTEETTVERQQNAVSLAPGESITVGVKIDVRDTLPSLVEFDVNARVPDEQGSAGPPGMRIDQIGDGSISVRAEDVSPGDSIQVDAGVESEPIVIRTIRVTTTQAGDLDMTVSVGDTSGSKPAVDDALGYVNVSHSMPATAFTDATFVFTVERSALASRGLSPENLSLYRFHDGTWTELPTRVVGAVGDRLRFRADSPGLSLFAVGPAASPTDPTPTATPTPTGSSPTPSESSPTPADSSPTPTDSSPTPPSATTTPSPTDADRSETPSPGAEQLGFGSPRDLLLGVAALVVLFGGVYLRRAFDDDD